MKNSPRSAFTLIEVLIVVVIMAILAAAIVPQFTDSTKDAKSSTAKFNLHTVTRREGFPTRAELIARYEERSGRSMSDVRWYQTLALWKSAVFLEGSYKRLLAGTTDDPFFKMLDEGVPEIARRAWDVAHGG